MDDCFIGIKIYNIKLLIDVNDFRFYKGMCVCYLLFICIYF